MKELPRQENAKEDRKLSTTEGQQIGQSLYLNQCAQCHGDHGEGRGDYPALAGNRTVIMNSSVNLVRIILSGGFAPTTEGNPRPMECRPLVIPSRTQRSLPLRLMFEMLGVIRPEPSCSLTCRKPDEKEPYANFVHAKDSALELHWHRRWTKTRRRLQDQPTGIDCNRFYFSSNLCRNTRHHCKSHGDSQLII